MKINIKDNKQMIITKLGQTQNENIVTEMDIQLPEKYKDYIKTICFIFPDDTEGYEVIGQEEIYYIPKAISQYSQVDFYIMLNSGDEDFRTETKTIKFYENKNVTGEVTPVELDNFNSVIKILEEEIIKVKNIKVDLTELEEKLETQIEKVNNLDIDAEKNDNITIISLTKKDGTIKEIEIKDGEQGEPRNSRRTW